MSSLAARRGLISPFTLSLAVFALGNLLLVNAAVILLWGTPVARTVIYHTSIWLSLDKGGTDSWKPMILAWNYIQSAPPNQRLPLYSQVFFGHSPKFQYAPTSLLVLYGLTAAGVRQPLWYQVLNWVSRILVAVMALFTWGILELSLRRYARRPAVGFSRADMILRGMVVAGLTITFYPVAKGFSLGQIQTWISCLFAVWLWCWLKDRRGVSGVWAGLICLWKPQLLVVMAWGLLRKQWRFTLAFASTFLAGVLISIWLFGLGDHLNYLSVLVYLSQHGQAYYPNQSVNGILNRLLRNGDSLMFHPLAAPPFNPWVDAGTLVSSVAWLGLALFWPAAAGEQGGAADLCLMVLSGTLASPIAWEHHFGVLLPMFAYLLPRLMAQRTFGSLTLPLLGLSYVLASNYLFFTNDLAVSPALAPFGVASLLQAYLFAAALLVWLNLHALRSARPRRAATPVTP